MRLAVIYGLFDPFDMSLRYVGVTRVSLTERLRAHLSDYASSRVGAWVAELKASGRIPVIERLSTCRASQATKAEAAAIRRYAPAGLLNLQHAPESAT